MHIEQTERGRGRGRKREREREETYTEKRDDVYEVFGESVEKSCCGGVVDGGGLGAIGLHEQTTHNNNCRCICVYTKPFMQNLNKYGVRFQISHCSVWFC